MEFFMTKLENMEHTISPPAHVLIAADNYCDDPEEARWFYEGSLWDNTFFICNRGITKMKSRFVRRDVSRLVPRSCIQRNFLSLSLSCYKDRIIFIFMKKTILITYIGKKLWILYKFVISFEAVNLSIFFAGFDFGNVNKRTMNRYMRRTLHGRARILIARTITTMTPGVVADLMKNASLNSCISQLADARSTRSRARR